MLTKKTSLKRSTGLKRSKSLSKTFTVKTRKRVPLEKKTAQQLVPVADEHFSKYIRIRDCWYTDEGWHGECISCSKKGIVAYFDDGKWKFTKGWDAGHFITRGIHQLRFEEENVNLQCSFHCNKMKSGNVEKQKPALDLKYGDGTWRQLEDLAQAEGAQKMLPKPEYLEIIRSSKEFIDHAFNNPDNYRRSDG